MNLRRRLLLSHVLPLVISIPLIGLVLIAAVETRVITPALISQIEENARITARLLAIAPDTWQNAANAQFFIDRNIGVAPWRLQLINTEGRILASNMPEDRTRYGLLTNEPEIAKRVQAGEIILETDFSTSLDTRIIDFWVPIMEGDQLLGIMRLSQPLANVLDIFTHLRMTVIAIVLSGLALGVLIGLGLAATMEQPLDRLAGAMSAMSSGKTPGLVQTSGPEELQLLARSFNLLVERLEREASNRNKLLSNLVHELGRPLGALRSAIQALARGADRNPELKAELLDGMDMQTRGLERLVEDLTQLYDRERGTLQIERVPTDLNQWFLTSTQAWQTLASEKGIKWSTSAGQLPPHEIDPIRLGQAWGNLLSNAIKYTPPGGEIEVAAENTSAEIRFSVTDTGPGLSNEDQEKIFVPFFRSNRDNRFPQGMGLGLSIAEELVRAHQGYIKFYSELGQGSTFIIALPLHPMQDFSTPDQDPA